MITLDEAIKHCEESAEAYKAQVEHGMWAKGSTTEQNYIKCAKEHRQLAEWLKDYKRLLAIESGVDIRCGNCKHDGSGDEVCCKCYEYKRWESVED